LHNQHPKSIKIFYSVYFTEIKCVIASGNILSYFSKQSQRRRKKEEGRSIIIKEFSCGFKAPQNRILGLYKQSLLQQALMHQSTQVDFVCIAAISILLRVFSKLGCSRLPKNGGKQLRVASFQIGDFGFGTPADIAVVCFNHIVLSNALFAPFQIKSGGEFLG
jgi:hypothetical protein